MRCILDGNKIADRKSLHDSLQEGLSLPEWYGRNLDALYDCLCDIFEECEICVFAPMALEESLGGYARCFFHVLENAAKRNPRLHIIITEPEA